MGPNPRGFTGMARFCGILLGLAALCLVIIGVAQATTILAAVASAAGGLACGALAAIAWCIAWHVDESAADRQEIVAHLRRLGPK